MRGNEEVEEARRMRELLEVVGKPGDEAGQREEGRHARALYVRMQWWITLPQNGQQQCQEL